MKKIFCIISLLFCLIPFCVYAESSSSLSFRYDLTFDSTVDDIIAAEGADPTFKIANYVLYEEVLTAGKASQVFYIMDDDGTISMCSIFINDKHSQEQKYVFDYNEIDKLLTEKYGDPSQPKDVKWFDTLFMDNPDKLGLAVCSGDALITTRWSLDGLHITHALNGDNYEFSHIITYSPVPFEEHGGFSTSAKDSGL